MILPLPEIVRLSAKALATKLVNGLMLEIALGRPVDGAPWPPAMRMRLLRSMRRRWDREEEQRCRRIRDEADRGGWVAVPLPEPWPELARLDDRLLAVAIARDERWRAHFVLDPFGSLGHRLDRCRARARKREALRIALSEIDSAFPSTSPSRSS